MYTFKRNDITAEYEILTETGSIIARCVFSRDARNIVEALNHTCN
jgi:hypothetical protein